mmetsp:Transcript_20824/g.62111  ORF Transcript_20824/g.62111 Transcript_20824/m.62111 type:complete len:521 (+) Transcript_20824:60-1622(+)
MSDPFAVLRGGARFKPNRTAQECRHGGTGRPASAAASRAALDFFGDGAASAPAASDAELLPKRRGDDATRTGKRRKTAGPAADAAAEVAVSATTLEESRVYRKRRRIYVKGTDPPNAIRGFNELGALGLARRTVAQLLSFGYDEPSAIQAQAIPSMMAGRDLLGIAPTGSGKTLAFSVPIVAALGGPAAKGFRAAIVAPTRELAVQIKREFDRIAVGTKLQVRLLDKSTASVNSFGPKTSGKFDVVITTPLRLVHALSIRGGLSLANVEWLVLDEADQLFENGFDQQVDEIIAACSKRGRRIALFSATMPQRVEELARSVLHDPLRVRVGAQNAAAVGVKQRLLYVSNEQGKMVAMRQLVQEGLKPPVLIFVQSKGRAKELFSELVYDGINVDVIHADRTKKQRDDVVKQFRAGTIWVLISTDLMARGVDFKGVNVVINYDFPANAVDYIHRIGRTGRAGRSGSAVTFFTEKDGGSLRSIANVMKSSGCDVPEWMFKLRNQRKGKARVVERESISTDAPK